MPQALQSVFSPAGPQAVYAHTLHWAHAWEVDASLVNVLDAAATVPPCWVGCGLA